MYRYKNKIMKNIMYIIYYVYNNNNVYIYVIYSNII